eukprot:519651-Pleurochrysis_carterae.AAC.2
MQHGDFTIFKKHQALPDVERGHAARYKYYSTGKRICWGVDWLSVLTAADGAPPLHSTRSRPERELRSALIESYPVAYIVSASATRSASLVSSSG